MMMMGAMLLMTDERNLVATEGRSNSVKGMRGIKDTEIKGANLHS